MGILVARGIAPKFLSRYPKTKQIRIKLAQSMSTYDDFINIIKELKILLFCIGIATGIFTLMNIASLIYKIIKKA